jgi:hypothetical protein
LKIENSCSFLGFAVIQGDNYETNKIHFELQTS